MERTKFNVEGLDRDTPIDDMEGWNLTNYYVRMFYKMGKFYSLNRRYDVEDLVSEIYVKFLNKGFFQKYNPKTTSKKYFVMVAVKNSLIDMLRKLRETASLEAEIEEGLTLGDMMKADICVEDEAIFEAGKEMGEWNRNAIIMQLPDDTRSILKGYSPLMGREVKLTYRVLAIHLEAGWSAKQISEIFINPNSGKPVTQGNISNHIARMREWILDNIVIA